MWTLKLCRWREPGVSSHISSVQKSLVFFDYVMIVWEKIPGSRCIYIFTFRSGGAWEWGYWWNPIRLKPRWHIWAMKSTCQGRRLWGKFENDLPSCSRIESTDDLLYFSFSSFFLPSQDVVPAAKEAYVKETGKKCDIVVDETNFLLADRYLLASLIPTTQVLIIYSMWNGMREYLDT